MSFIRDIDYGGVTWEVEFDASPYIPATMYRANGDPGDPAEGGEVELIRVSLSLEEVAVEEPVDLMPFLDENTLDEIEARCGEFDDLFEGEEP